MKPIQTRYKGRLFRSRLEARWAVFFDALGIPWQYESEGFELDNGEWYLPDFFLPEQETWVEIKPIIIEGWHDKKAMEFAKHKAIVVLCGEPGPIEPYANGNPYEGYVSGDFSYYWCECPFCGALGIQFDGRSARNRHKKGCKVLADYYDKHYNMDSPLILAAYKSALSARFEVEIL